MRFDSGKLALWYGTADAAAPGDSVFASQDKRALVSIAVAVTPPSLNNKVQIIYRINGAAAQKAHAVQTRQDLVKKVQYFSAKLPPFQVGDFVEYVAVLTSPIGQVPADTDKLPSSFHVLAGESKSTAAASTTSTKQKSGSTADSTPANAATSKPAASNATSSTATKDKDTATKTGAANADESPLAKEQLLSLLKFERKTPLEVKSADAALFKKIVEVVNVERKVILNRLFKANSKSLVDAVKKITFAPPSADDNSFSEIILSGLSAQKISSALLQEAKRKLAHCEQAGSLQDAISFCLPIMQQDLFEKELKLASLYQLTGSLNISDAKTKLIIAKGESPALIDDDVLGDLVDEKSLTLTEANEFGLLLSIYALVDESGDLALAIKPQVKSLQEIIKVSVADWLDAITKSDPIVPTGLDANTYALALRRAATNLYPGEALQANGSSVDMKAVESALNAVAPLFPNNPQLFSCEFDDLDVEAIAAADLVAVQSAFETLSRLVNRNVGLALDDIITGTNSAAEKIKLITARIAIVPGLMAQNPDQEFMGLDYSEGSRDISTLKSDGIATADLHFAYAHLKALQRLHALTRNVDHTHQLLAAGYGSASSVAMDNCSDFTAKSKLGKEDAENYYHKASSALSRASNAVISAIDAYDGPFHHTRAGNVHDEVKDHLKAIPGFSDLFGSQNYCNCSQCQSILGAAAYFVDLMTFIEENMTGKVFRGSKKNHPLNLKSRRPDLWTLPLTCSNTNDLISYLDVINPTLEDYICRQRTGQNKKGDAKPAQQTLVYLDTLAHSCNSFNQPFVLPLETLDIYLEHFSVPRVQIAQTLGADPVSIVKAALKISDVVYNQILAVAPDPEFLKQVYGISFGFAGAGSHVPPVNIVDMTQATGYSRNDLETALLSNYVTKNGSYKIAICAEKKNADSVQNDVENIHELTADALHRLYRFTRLLRVTPWAISDLDLILSQLGAIEESSGLNEQCLSTLVQLIGLRSRWTMPVDQSCALWSLIPYSPGSGSLFNRLFNFAPLMVSDSKLPIQELSYVHAAFSKSGTGNVFSAASSGAGAASSSSETENQQIITQRILAGLQVNDNDLIALITGLATALKVNLSGNADPERAFALSLANLSLLYRHALLARQMNLSIAQLFQTIKLSNLKDQYVTGLADLGALLSFHDWVKSSPYQLDDLGTICNGVVLNPARYPSALTLATAISQQINTDHALEFSDKVFVTLFNISEAESQAIIALNPNLFAAIGSATTPTYQLTSAFRSGATLQFADTVLSYLPGVTAAQSQQIVAANPTLFTAAANTATNADAPLYQLAAGFGASSALTIPEAVSNAISLTPATACAALLKYATAPGSITDSNSPVYNYHPANLIPASLCGLLGVDAVTLAQFVTLTGVDLGSAAMFGALETGTAATQLAPLTSLINQLISLKVLFPSSEFSDDDVNFIAQNGPLFAISNFNSISISNVQKLSVYAKFAENLAANNLPATALRDVLLSFSSHANFNSADPVELANVLGIDSKHLQIILPCVTLPGTPTEALTDLAAFADLTQTLGVGGDALKLVLSDAYTDQILASGAILSAFRAQYKDEYKFLADCKPYDDKVRTRKRDALADYLLHWNGYQFGSFNDLYNYFLLDVQLESCMQTSWVVAALSSVQLYVYRVLMNLEQDDLPDGDPDHIHVKMDEESEEQWDWRRNYRVWQANREVFLYPENYLLPELRDDMTPLFQDMDAALLQQPINSQNVLDAYSAYLSGFDRLSKLQIAGSYHDIDPESRSDVLHLFGVTPADPPVFYYRAIDNAKYGETEIDKAVTYTPWVPVKLQIPTREISPISYLGRLFVFWTQTSSVSQNLIVNANSIFNGYKHTWRVKYSYLQIDQSWAAPQQLSLADPTVFNQGDSVVIDPLLDYLDKYFYGNDTHTTSVMAALAVSTQSQAQQNLLSAYVKWQQQLIDKNYSSSELNLSNYQAALTPLYGDSYQTGPVDNYTLTGFQWNRVYPSLNRQHTDLLLTGRNFCMRTEKVDFYNQLVVAQKKESGGKGQQVLCSMLNPKDRSQRQLYLGFQDHFPKLSRYAWCTIVTKSENITKIIEAEETADLYFNNLSLFWSVNDLRQFQTQSITWSGGEPLKKGLYRKQIASLPDDSTISMVNGSIEDSISDAIIDIDSDVLYLQDSVRPGKYVLKRLTTTLGENLSRALFTSGVDGLLNLDTQLAMKESKTLLEIRHAIEDELVVGKMDYKGSMGTYFREIFFHAPYMIASQLNAQQDFESAQRWYRYIFDPTASDPDDKHGKHDKRDKRDKRDEHDKHDKHDEHDEHDKNDNTSERDQVWRYLEFRNLDVPSLRSILTNASAIQAYEQNPFNPHAIARLRLSAYQKATVMNYVENLINWGDTLFTEFQMETVNEATLLYVQVSEVMGLKPIDVGDCGGLNQEERTYERIAPLVKKGSDFLIEMETYTHQGCGAARRQPKQKLKPKFTLGRTVAKHYFDEAVHPGSRHANTDHRDRPDQPTDFAKLRDEKRLPKSKAERGSAHAFHWKNMPSAARNSSSDHDNKSEGHKKGKNKSLGQHGSRFGWSVARHVIPVFCIPPNLNLLAYWDTVEDRLYKIRHGMDITGALRQLSLFAPAINPMMLVEGGAAGMSFDDVLNSTSGNVPPYRFTYLIEKARLYSSQVQSFGTTLLAAIEKRDGQTLEVLRVTQQQNILAMTTASKQAEIDAAQNAIDTLNAQMDTTQFKHDYFQGLVENGLIPLETQELDSRITAAGLNTASAIFSATAGIMHLVIDLGSPFAMKFGGKEMGDSLRSFSQLFRDLGSIEEIQAGLSGLLGGHQRRSDGWQHEVDMATKEIAQLNEQLVGANIRLTIARKSMDIHQKSIAQNQQIAAFYTSRFSNIALYSWLASNMRGLYRQAYSSAYSMAKLAEQAYRFERNDDTSILLSKPYWSQAQAGLQAGEMLLGDLISLEQKFIESNYRTPEITQSFSMMQIAPAALLNLRQNASGSFTIPELCFDLFYPGQYCRKIKAVRITIPCVTGPLTNVGATLSLTASNLRLNASDTSLTPLMLRHSNLIATSTAQNDGGVFEFSFRDERYMPFEGAGAISSWIVALPDGFRQFDYQTISDVIVHISYTALQDDQLRTQVEKINGTLAKALSSQPLARLFSLRQEFPSVLNRLQHNALNTPVTMTVATNMLPYFIASQKIKVSKAALLLRTAGSQTQENCSITIDGAEFTSFVADTSMGGLLSCDVSSVFTTRLIGDHIFSVTSAADLAPAAAAPVAAASTTTAAPSTTTAAATPATTAVTAAVPAPPAFDDTKLLDMILYIEYQLAGS